MKTLRRFLRDERGASLFEYALLLIIGLGAAAVLFLLRERIMDVFRRASDSLNW